eukprot:9898945-Alexandrium_andersonii.AAC.1
MFTTSFRNCAIPRFREYAIARLHDHATLSKGGVGEGAAARGGVSDQAWEGPAGGCCADPGRNREGLRER